MKTPRKHLLLNQKQFLQGDQHSQGVVEFALAAPILLMMLFAIIDFSLLFSAWLLIQNISRQAVRYGVTGAWESAYCQNGCVDINDQTQARIQSIQAEAMKYTAGLLVNTSVTSNTLPGYLKVTICSGKDNIVQGETGTTTYSDCRGLKRSIHCRCRCPG